MGEIVVGVIGNRSAAWFIDELHNAIDLEFEHHCANCPNEYHDDCWETVGNETLLLGFVKCKLPDSEAWFDSFLSYGYKPDEKAEFSAIVGETYTQVVKSRWYVDCHKCSLCYPFQGDLETEGNFYRAYCLPPDMFGDSDDLDVGRIKEVP